MCVCSIYNRNYNKDLKQPVSTDQTCCITEGWGTAVQNLCFHKVIIKSTVLRNTEIWWNKESIWEATT